MTIAEPTPVHELEERAKAFTADVADFVAEEAATHSAIKDLNALNAVIEEAQRRHDADPRLDGVGWDVLMANALIWDLGPDFGSGDRQADHELAVALVAWINAAMANRSNWPKNWPDNGD